MSIQIKLEGGAFDGHTYAAKAGCAEVLIETLCPSPWGGTIVKLPPYSMRSETIVGIGGVTHVEDASRFERYRRVGRLDDGGLPIFKAITQ